MIKTIDTTEVTKEMTLAFHEIVSVNGLGVLYNFEDAVREMLEQAPTVEPAHDEVPMPQNADQAQLMALVAESWLKHNAPERLKEPVQAVPVGRVLHWQGEPGLAPETCIRGFAEYPKGYAQLGPWREGEPVFTRPAPLDSDTRRLVLELCRLTIDNGAVDGIVTAAMEAMAADILERLEAGE